MSWTGLSRFESRDRSLSPRRAADAWWYPYRKNQRRLERPVQRKARIVRRVEVARKPDGRPVNVPREVSAGDLEQYLKRFIEVASESPQDASPLVSMFRSFHGGRWTIRVLEMALQELRNPTIELEIARLRKALLPMFELLLQQHERHGDAEFGYPRRDRSRLPL